jgi:hypothetical protein
LRGRLYDAATATATPTATATAATAAATALPARRALMNPLRTLHSPPRTRARSRRAPACRSPKHCARLPAPAPARAPRPLASTPTCTASSAAAVTSVCSARRGSARLPTRWRRRSSSTRCSLASRPLLLPGRGARRAARGGAVTRTRRARARRRAARERAAAASSWCQRGHGRAAPPRACAAA